MKTQTLPQLLFAAIFLIFFQTNALGRSNSDLKAYALSFQGMSQTLCNKNLTYFKNELKHFLGSEDLISRCLPIEGSDDFGMIFDVEHREGDPTIFVSADLSEPLRIEKIPETKEFLYTVPETRGGVIAFQVKQMTYERIRYITNAFEANDFFECETMLATYIRSFNSGEIKSEVPTHIFAGRCVKISGSYMFMLAHAADLVEIASSEE